MTSQYQVIAEDGTPIVEGNPLYIYNELMTAIHFVTGVKIQMPMLVLPDQKITIIGVDEVTCTDEDLQYLLDNYGISMTDTEENICQQILTTLGAEIILKEASQCHM